MNTKLVTLVVAGLLTAGTAFAASDSTRPTQSEEDCIKLVDVTRETAEGNDVGEKAQSEIDKLFVQLQTQCNEEQFQAADETASLIRGLVATE